MSSPVAKNGKALSHARPDSTVVWYDLAYSESAATSCCPSMAFFRGDDHLQQWLAGQTSPRAGYRLALEEGKFDAEQVRAFWFDSNGLLLKSYFKGIESQRSEFEDFNDIKIAHRIDLLKDGKLGMRIRVTEIATAASVPPKTFEVPKHEWKRAFTDEAR